MKRGHVNPATGRRVSRQRAHQLRNINGGMCMYHKDRPANGMKGFCEECTGKVRALHGTKKPHPLKEAWESVDFTLKPKQITAQLGAKVEAVYVQRNKRGLKTIRCERISKRQLNAAAFDLLKSLQAVVEICDRDTVEFTAAKAAITKATGKPFECATLNHNLSHPTTLNHNTLQSLCHTSSTTIQQPPTPASPHWRK